MKSPIPDYLKLVLEQVAPLEGGKAAQDIEALARVDTSKMAVAIATVDGTVYSAGDDVLEFSIQSISKAFVYALAISDVGISGVLEKIGVEPSGDPFNELSLERGPRNRPMNPMINAGAITAHSLVAGSTPEERVGRILDILSRLAGRQLEVDEEVYEAELNHAYRNMGLAYMLKAAGILECSPADAVRGYVRQCAINVHVRDLAMISATLCNGGVQPNSGETIISQDSVRQVLSVMTTCGMYDASGDWVSKVGIPAKSGIGGGIIGALPGQLGLAVFSPRIDDRGNSVRGVAMCEALSRDLGLHMMDMRQVSHSTMRQSVTTIDCGSKGRAEVPIFEMRGAVRFGGAELLTRTVARQLNKPVDGDEGSGLRVECPAVIFSFRATVSLSFVAQRILREDISRLKADGKDVVVVDPSHVLDMSKFEEGDRPEVYGDMDEALNHVGGVGYKVVSDHE